jgi:hypothetical protein
MTHVSEERIERAKASLLRQIGEEPWLRSIGIGLVADGPGLVISVARAGKHAAKAAIAGLKTPVPTRVQVVGVIRKRAQD